MNKKVVKIKFKTIKLVLLDKLFLVELIKKQLTEISKDQTISISTNFKGFVKISIFSFKEIHWNFKELKGIYK